MFRDGKLPLDIKQYFPAVGKLRIITPILATRIVAVILALSLILPLPWFTLSDSGKSISGTRLLSYAFDGFSIPFLFSASPVLTSLLIAMPIVITILSLMTLSDAILNKAKNVRDLSTLNIIVMLVLMYAATVVADPTQHIISGGVIVLPKWGMWITFLSAIGLALLSVGWTNLNARTLLDSYKRLFTRDDAPTD